MPDFERLREHYSYFLNSQPGRILLTGHSHQAWPDVSRDAQLKAWDDAALHVDEKWNIIFGEVIPAFQKHIAKRIGESNPSNIAIGQNTFEFLYRLLSCFPIDSSMRIVSTTSEFHSLSRLLSRLREDCVHIIHVDTNERSTLSKRIIDAITEGTTFVMVSLVFFDTCSVLQHVNEICERSREVGAIVLLDAYHAFNVLPISVADYGEDVFIVGGGYKYSQSGEAAAWMRVSAGTALRPVYTGWFADFGSVEHEKANRVGYSDDAFRFIGATFDPTPFYRANTVFDFMDEQGLTPEVLRACSLLLTSKIIEEYDSLKLHDLGVGLTTSRHEHERGGFISFVHNHAQELSKRLRANNVWTDVRGKYVRFGPAPYITEREIEQAMKILKTLLQS